MTFTDYNQYFELLAAQHRQLLHRPDSCHFTRGELEEFFQTFRSRVLFPCLILETSEVSYPTTSLATTTRRRTGAFIVANTYGVQKDYDDMQLSLAVCERIAEDMIGRMAADADERTAPFAAVEQASMVYMQNQAMKYVGARVEFTVTAAACLHREEMWRE